MNQTSLQEHGYHGYYGYMLAVYMTLYQATIFEFVVKIIIQI